MSDKMSLERRYKNFQENVNRRVVMEYVRITGIDNPKRRPLDYVLKDFGESVLKVPETIKDWYAWPAPAGTKGSSVAIRAKITYPFWKFFLNEGRKNLSEYNKLNDKNIIVSREKTIELSDQDKLCLYIRKRIRDAYTRERKRCVEIAIKKGTMKIGSYEPMSPAIIAICLDIDLTEWNGLPLDALLTEEEKKLIENGVYKKGTLVLERLENFNVVNDKDVVNNVE